MREGTGKTLILFLALAALPLESFAGFCDTLEQRYFIADPTSAKRGGQLFFRGGKVSFGGTDYVMNYPYTCSEEKQRIKISPPASMADWETNFFEATFNPETTDIMLEDIRYSQTALSQCGISSGFYFSREMFDKTRDADWSKNEKIFLIGISSADDLVTFSKSIYEPHFLDCSNDTVKVEVTNTITAKKTTKVLKLSPDDKRLSYEKEDFIRGAYEKMLTESKFAE